MVSCSHGTAPKVPPEPAAEGVRCGVVWFAHSVPGAASDPITATEIASRTGRMQLHIIDILEAAQSGSSVHINGFLTIMSLGMGRQLWTCIWIANAAARL